MTELVSMAQTIGALLKERGERWRCRDHPRGGGLVSAALLAVPGASAYFVGGGVIYTQTARDVLLALDLKDHPGCAPAAKPTRDCGDGAAPSPGDDMGAQ